MLSFARTVLLLSLTVAFSRLAAAEPVEIVSLRAKAEKGNSIAQYNLGLAYIQGQQVPADLSEAFVWLTLASEHGSAGKALNEVLGTISEPQLAEGKKRLETYRATIAAGSKPPVTAASTVPNPVARNATVHPTPVSAPTPSAPISRASEPVVAKASIDSSAAEIASLRGDRHELGEELALAWKESNQLKKDLTATQAALADSKAHLATQTAELAKLREQSAKSTAAADAAKLAADLATAQKEIENARAAAAANATKVSAAEAAAATLNTEKKRLTAERDAADAARAKAVADAEERRDAQGCAVAAAYLRESLRRVGK